MTEDTRTGTIAGAKTTLKDDLKIAQPVAAVARTPGRVFRNTSSDCRADAVQVLLNNEVGEDTIATMTVTNRGKCPVSVGTGAQRGDFSYAGGETFVPGGSSEFVRVKVPAGSFLLASCVGGEDCGCKWTITDLSV
ncbi:MAG: hypothetical protein KDJ77_08790 [Rhodobiaceae bacterium]|nr:hypothetical protein [Rhodobiaceae bacterium]